ncbi:hypothetical protein [Gordonia rhizosphera]|uniref:Uncharacterized protein n=1 Tax=Gordonia rhizosphera NBRC 16068 TaxID=1108045 RepID=K6WPQ6_9ACTN|nr:hypothetical protein [Gordonia rhizosphera]GAB88524.1 hypothetical protein GORHZ_026_00230 [Gordonia rhizosphera NBRC 16068]
MSRKALLIVVMVAVCLSWIAVAPQADAAEPRAQFSAQYGTILIRAWGLGKEDKSCSAIWAKGTHISATAVRSQSPRIALRSPPLWHGTYRVVFACATYGTLGNPIFSKDAEVKV